ncbi:MAG TPA: ion transporter [Polyangiaceae bacterium]
MDPGPRREHRIRGWLARPGVQLAVAIVIVAWMGLTITEIAVTRPHAPPGQRNELEWLSFALAVLFAIELALRYVSSTSRARFVRENWADVVAILATTPTLAAAWPVVRVLRLLRVVRLVDIAQRLPVLPGIARRRTARRAIGLAAFITVAALTCSAALLAFESGSNAALSSFGQAFWFSLYSIFATQPTPDPPLTLGGRVVSLVLIFVGLSTFALLTGSVSAIVGARLRDEGAAMDWEDLEGHLILCGWNRKAEIIVREYDAANRSDPMPVVVIARIDGEPQFADPSLRKRVLFLDDDCTKITALEKAGIHKAKSCVIMSDTTRGRSERDADARTILAALTVERLNGKVYTCAELNRREYAQHLALGCVDDFVVGGEHSAFLLAQAALNRGTLNVFSELLSYEYGHKFCRIEVPPDLVGKPFVDAFVEMKQKHNVTLIAIMDEDGKSHINPQDTVLRATDSLVVIAAHDYRA